MASLPRAKINKDRTHKRHNDTWVVGDVGDLPTIEKSQLGEEFVKVRLGLRYHPVQIMGYTNEIFTVSDTLMVKHKWIGIVI